MTKKYSLTGMDLDEVSFVDKGANPGAKILFWKHDEAAVDPTRQNIANMVVNVDATLLSDKVRTVIKDAFASYEFEERKAAVAKGLEKTRAFLSKGGDHDKKEHGNWAEDSVAIEKFATDLADLHKCCEQAVSAAPSSIQPQVASTFDELMDRREVQASAEEFQSMVYALQDSFNSIAADKEVPEDVRRDLLVRSFNEFKAAVEEEIVTGRKEQDARITKVALQLAVAKSKIVLSKGGDHDQKEHGNWAEGGVDNESSSSALATYRTLSQAAIEPSAGNALVSRGEKIGDVVGSAGRFYVKMDSFVGPVAASPKAALRAAINTLNGKLFTN